MIYITQLIYITEGEEAVFDAFEAAAIPIIARYNGRLLFRLRPPADAYMELHMEQPYEIHFIAFNSQQDFDNFKLDEERKQFLHLKERSIRAALLYQGTQL